MRLEHTLAVGSQLTAAANPLLQISE